MNKIYGRSMTEVDLGDIERRIASGSDSLEPSGEVTDKYKVEASKMFGVPYEQVTDEQRKMAKLAMYREIYS